MLALISSATSRHQTGPSTSAAGGSSSGYLGQVGYRLLNAAVARESNDVLRCRFICYLVASLLTLLLLSVVYFGSCGGADAGSRACESLSLPSPSHFWNNDEAVSLPASEFSFSTFLEGLSGSDSDDDEALQEDTTNTWVHSMMAPTNDESIDAPPHHQQQEERRHHNPSMSASNLSAAAHDRPLKKPAALVSSRATVDDLAAIEEYSSNNNDEEAVIMNWDGSVAAVETFTASDFATRSDEISNKSLQLEPNFGETSSDRASPEAAVHRDGNQGDTALAASPKDSLKKSPDLSSSSSLSSSPSSSAAKSTSKGCKTQIIGAFYDPRSNVIRVLLSGRLQSSEACRKTKFQCRFKYHRRHLSSKAGNDDSNHDDQADGESENEEESGSDDGSRASYDSLQNSSRVTRASKLNNDKSVSAQQMIATMTASPESDPRYPLFFNCPLPPSVSFADSIGNLDATLAVEKRMISEQIAAHIPPFLRNPTKKSRHESQRRVTDNFDGDSNYTTKSSSDAMWSQQGYPLNAQHQQQQELLQRILSPGMQVNSSAIWLEETHLLHDLFRLRNAIQLREGKSTGLLSSAPASPSLLSMEAPTDESSSSIQQMLTSSAYVSNITYVRQQFRGGVYPLTIWRSVATHLRHGELLLLAINQFQTSRHAAWLANWVKKHGEEIKSWRQIQYLQQIAQADEEGDEEKEAEGVQGEQNDVEEDARDNDVSQSATSSRHQSNRAPSHDRFQTSRNQRDNIRGHQHRRHQHRRRRFRKKKKSRHQKVNANLKPKMKAMGEFLSAPVPIVSPAPIPFQGPPPFDQLDILTQEGDMAYQNLGVMPAVPIGAVKYRYRYSALSVIRNSAVYLTEWLCHHILLGFDHFYIYDDGSQDHPHKVLAPFIALGFVTLVDWPLHHLRDRQFLAMQDFLFRFGHETEHILPFDVDMYVLPVSIPSYPSATYATSSGAATSSASPSSYSAPSELLSSMSDSDASPAAKTAKSTTDPLSSSGDATGTAASSPSRPQQQWPLRKWRKRWRSKPASRLPPVCATQPTDHSILHRVASKIFNGNRNNKRAGVSSIVLNWNLFGSSFLESRPALMSESYIYHQKSEPRPRRRRNIDGIYIMTHSTLAKTACIRSSYRIIHFWNMKCGQTEKQMAPRSGQYLLMNHYYIKSLEDWRHRGLHGWIKWRESLFRKANRGLNAQRDMRMHCYLPDLKLLISFVENGDFAALLELKSSNRLRYGRLRNRLQNSIQHIVSS